MRVCVGLSQCMLIVFNLIFALFGLVFLVVGCVVRFGSNLLDDILQDFYSDLQSIMEQAGSEFSLANFNLGDYLQSATLAFILLGTFFLLLGVTGCVGACCRIKCFLIIYAIIMGVIILAEIIFVVLLFTIRDQLESALKSPLYESLENDFKGINSSDAISLGWNFAMINFKCCGVENYTDFEKASQWSRHYKLPNGTDLSLTVPIACCKLNGSFPNVKLPENLNCASSPTLDNANIDQGCYDAITDFLVDNSDIMIGVGTSVVVIEILLFIFAVCVCRSHKKDKVDEVGEW